MKRGHIAIGGIGDVSINAIVGMEFLFVQTFEQMPLKKQ